MPSIIINGIVSNRDKQPYVQILTEQGMIVQLSMNEARSVAMDILRMASRTEADAMILKFFDKAEFPNGAAAALMHDFREFRSELDAEEIQKRETDPDA
jgi:hypothetical protein